VYTLVVRPDNTFEILVDRESVRKGSLYEDFEPTVLPPKEIDDIEDRMPDDWVVDPTIPDPAAKKPDDWDENAPYEIPDPAAKKPDDWFENEEAMVVDPEAVKPADWDAEEDGEWQAPLITNPKCEDASGCGPWSAPMIKNPAFKGQWYAPTIANPAFKGHWRPRKIPNPDFFDDQHVSNFEKIAAIGFEIWTMQSGILFDNVYLGHSEDDAKQLADETWAIKHAIEKAMLEAETVQDLEDDKNNDPVDDEDVTLAKQPVKFIRQQVNKFILMSKEDVLEAVFEMPYVAAGLLGAVLMLLAAVFSVLGLVSGGSSSTEETDKSTKKEEASSAAEGTEGESTATPKKTVKRKKKNAKE
jgi:calnexin